MILESVITSIFAAVRPLLRGRSDGQRAKAHAAESPSRCRYEYCGRALGFGRRCVNHGGQAATRQERAAVSGRPLVRCRPGAPGEKSVERR